jgi:hypothetical protein
LRLKCNPIEYSIGLRIEILELRGMITILQSSLFNILELGFFSQKFSLKFNEIKIHLQSEKTTESGSFEASKNGYQIFMDKKITVNGMSLRFSRTLKKERNRIVTIHPTKQLCVAKIIKH